MVCGRGEIGMRTYHNMFLILARIAQQQTSYAEDDQKPGFNASLVAEGISTHKSGHAKRPSGAAGEIQRIRRQPEE